MERRGSRTLVSLMVIALHAAACSWLDPDNLEEGKRALRKGDPQAAYQALRQAVLDSPKSGDAHRLLARASLMTLRISPGAAAARRAVELQPEDASAHVLLALLAGRRQQFLPALAAAREAIRLDPSHAEPHLVLGELLLQGGRAAAPDHAAAESEFREALRLEPENLRARFDLGKVLVLQGEHEEGEQRLLELLGRGLNSGEVRFLLGTVRLQRREFDQAEADFRAASRLSPSRPEPYFHLSQILYRQGRREEAERFRDRHLAVKRLESHLTGLWLAYSVESEDARVAMELARYLAENRLWEDAITILQSLCLDHPKLPRPPLLLVEVALEAEHPQEVGRGVEQALALGSTNPRAHRLAARFESICGHPERAVPHAREATRLEPDKVEYRIALAEVFLESGNVPEALDVLQDVLASAPDHPRVAAALGAALLQTGSPAQAEQRLTTALSQRPRRFQWLQTRGRARVVQSKLEGAREDLERALELAPEQLSLYEDLAQVLEAQGKEREAREVREAQESARRRGAQIEQLRREMGSPQQNLEVAMRLADLLEETGKIPEAGRLRVRALGAQGAW